MRHYTHQSFIAETQHGFQKGLSCDTQLVSTTEQLQKGMDQKYQQDIILLNFQKAFDKVPHRHLLKMDLSFHRLELPPYVMKPTRTSKNHHSHSFQNIRAQSDQYLHSFLPRTIRTWNHLATGYSYSTIAR